MAEDGTLCQSTHGYVERMSDNFERMFGHKPREYKSPLEPNDHPELDLTPELDEDGIQPKVSVFDWFPTMDGITGSN